ncbi:NAD(P)H-binding protein [Pseudomonadota bacterium]
MRMKILVTGASGFIGSHLIQALITEGHEPLACARSEHKIKQRWPDMRTIKADFTQDHDADDWLPRLRGIDIVINAAGIIRETSAQTFDALHTTGPCALFKAAELAGVKKVIQISALGADQTAFSQYHLSKRAADEYLAGLNLEWVIVKPSIVYGPGAKSMEFFKSIAAFPVMPLIDKGDQPIQPIYINDLTRAILQLIKPDAPKQISINMVGPHPVTIKELYQTLRHWLGKSNGRFLSLPYSLSLSAAWLGGFMGPPPMTKEAVHMLRNGNTADVTPFIQTFGFTPSSFKSSLTQTLAQQSDHWHADLYLLRPLLRISIAFLWIFTGIVSAFVFPIEQSYAMLAKAGISREWAPIMLYGAAFTDLALGVATLMRYRISLVASIQIAIVLLYTVIITFSQPEQWQHPFGPISKNIPLIVATLVMIALERRS